MSGNFDERESSDQTAELINSQIFRMTESLASIHKTVYLQAPKMNKLVDLINVHADYLVLWDEFLKTGNTLIQESNSIRPSE